MAQCGIVTIAALEAGHGMDKIPLTEEHLKILEARGLERGLLIDLGISSLLKESGNWVCIPYIANGLAVNHKYRTISGEKRFQQDGNARKCFWNIDCLIDPTLENEPLIITEGEFDAIAAMQAGYRRVVSVPDGAPANEIGDKPDSKKYSYLDDAAEYLLSVKDIILCTDNDTPGQNLMNDLALRLGKARCKWVKYPKNCKDLNDALKLYGVRGVTETISRSQWCQVEGVYRMGELPPVPERRAFLTGIPGLDLHYKIRAMDFCVITGIPSHGKSSFINDLACNMVESHGWGVVFASFEQQPQIDHRRNLRTWRYGKQVRDLTPEQIKKADEWIDENFSFIVPGEDDEVTLAWTLEKCAAAILRYGAKLVVIDPWNEMDHERPAGMSLTEYTGFAIKQFKKLAKKYQVHVIVAAHPTKQQKEADGKFKIPTLYDISDSAHWYNRCDVGLVVHRKDQHATIIRVAKSRYHDQIGKPGDIEVSFDIYSNRYKLIESRDNKYGG